MNLGTWVLIGSLLCLLFHLKWCGGMRVVTLLAKDIDITSPLMPTSYLSNVSSHGVQLEPTHTPWSMVRQDRHIYPVLNQYFSFYLSVDGWLCSRQILEFLLFRWWVQMFSTGNNAFCHISKYSEHKQSRNKFSCKVHSSYLVFAQKMRLPIECCPKYCLTSSQEFSFSQSLVPCLRVSNDTRSISHYIG